MPIAFLTLLAAVALTYGPSNEKPISPSPTASGEGQSMADTSWPEKRYPRMSERLGLETFDRATLLVPAIADQVLQGHACDRINLVKIANSSTPRGVEYDVLCKNGHQAEIVVDLTPAKS